MVIVYCQSISDSRSPLDLGSASATAPMNRRRILRAMFGFKSEAIGHTTDANANKHHASMHEYHSNRSWKAKFDDMQKEVSHVVSPSSVIDFSIEEELSELQMRAPQEPHYRLLRIRHSMLRLITIVLPANA